MAVIKGTNSYVSVAEADSYFADRVDSAVWAAASDTLKNQVLVSATMLLDIQSWAGTAITENQPLAFPRNCEYFDPRVGSSILLNGDTPKRVTDATFELAMHLLQNEGILGDSGSVRTLSVGTITLNNIQEPSMLPKIVKTLIKPLLVNAGSSGWWRAN